MPLDYDNGYTSAAPEDSGAIFNFYPAGTALEPVDNPGGDKLFLRSDGVLVREKSSDLTLWYYDLYGRVFRIENRSGAGYDLRWEEGRLEEITDDSGRVIDLLWNGERLAGIDDYANRQIRYSYSGDYLSGVTDFSGDTTGYQYRLDGRLDEIVKADGSQIDLLYQDVEGHQMVVGTTDEEGNTESFEYSFDAEGEVQSTLYTNSSGVWEKYEFASPHKESRVEHSDGSLEEFDYDDANGQLLSHTDRLGRETRYSYSDRGEVEEILHSDGSRELMSYAPLAAGILTSYRDRHGNQYSYSYDGFGRLIGASYPDGSQITRSYTAGGLLAGESVEGRQMSFAYDGEGRLTERTLHSTDGQQSRGELYEYNNRKDLIWVRSFDGVWSRLIYDRRHKLIYRIDGLADQSGFPDANIDYASLDFDDLKSRYLRVEYRVYREDEKPMSRFVGGKENPDVYREEYSYSEGGYLAGKISYKNDQLSASESYLYGPGGRLDLLHDGEGRAVSYAYDSHSQLIRESYGRYQNGRFDGAFYQGSLAEQHYSWEYGRLRSFSDLWDLDTLYRYDAMGRVAETGRGMISENQSYDRLGRLSARTGEDGLTYRFIYDNLDRLIQVIGPDSTVIERRRYDSRSGLLSEIEDALGRVTQLEYDGYDRPVKKTDPGGGEVLYSYDDMDRLVLITDEAGGEWSRRYDELGRLVQSGDPYGDEGALYTYRYDAADQLVEVSDSGGGEYRYEYDGQGRMIRGALPGGFYEVYRYDQSGHMVEKILPTGRIESFEYDDLGYLTSYSPGKGIFYRYGRSAAGDLLSDTDPLGHRRYARYDELGRLISQTSQNGHTRTLRYQGSLLSEIIDFNGHSTHYSYDDYNRIIQERYERGTEVSYRYDAVGNLLEAAGEEGNRLFYEYDELNRLIRETDDRFSSDIGFRYDERGNKTHVLRDGIIREVYTYGQRGELLSVSDEENQDIRFEYDVMGREILRQFPGGVEQRRIYDDWGRPVGVSAYRETGSMRYDFLWGEGYVYNSGGQRSRIVRHTGKVREFEYDDMDRLARVSYPFSDEILLKSYRDRLDAGLFPQQRSPGGDSFIQYLLNSDPGEVTLKADIMKLVSDKSKVYPELFDPDLSSAYYFSPGEGALNQFRTLKNSGDAEVLAVWKEIAPPGTQRVHFSGCQWSEYYQYDSAGNRASIQNGWGMIESRYGQENQLIQRGQRHFDYDGNGNLIQERVERSTADYSYNARNRMKGVQMRRRGTVGLAEFESGSNTLSYTYDALGRRQSRTTSAGERTLYRYGDFGLNPMEERTQIGSIPMQLESDLRKAKDMGYKE